MAIKVISKHEYFLPFSWRLLHKSNLYSPVQIHSIEHKLFDNLKGWKQIVEQEMTEKHYNEKVYFYPTVQSILYPNKQNTLLKAYKKENQSLTDYLEIQIEQTTYKLLLKNIQLKIYRTGIGILDFMLINEHYEDEEAIMAINSIGKCIYPYHLPIEEAQKDFFPRAITISVNGKCLCETFDKDYEKCGYTMNPIIQFMLGESFYKELIVQPLMNNRMFVLCMYYNPKLLTSILTKQIQPLHLSRFMNFSYKDKGGKNHLIELPHVVYGIGRFSIIAISGTKAHLYNQLVTLALVQRASILHFSSQVASISALKKMDLVYAIRCMYEIYIQFITRIYFDEVTVDVEGTQIYSALMEQLQVQKELKQLDFEMKEIHEYAMLIEKNQSKNRVDFLAIVGAALVIPTFVTGFFGMNILEDMFLNWWKHREIALWFNTYVGIPILVVLLFYTWGSRRNHWRAIQRVVLIIVLLISIIIVIKFGCGLVI